MITGKDVRVELNKAKKVYKNPEATEKERIEALYNLVQVVVKIVVGNRKNTARIMEKLGIEKVKNEKEETKEDTTQE